MPRISLITPSLQQQPYLRDCFTSVHDQGYAELEHIVVDGGSTDGSVAEIEAMKDRLAWYCSEPDRGQSHALNKGLEHATGAVFGWLNSDDLLLPGSLQRIGSAFEREPELVAYGGQRLYRDANGHDRISELDHADDIDGLFIHPQVNQQSTFYRMDLVRRVGGVEEGLHFAMDLELWWQILFTAERALFRFDEVPLAVFRLHDEAKTATGGNAFRDETAIILHHLAVQLDQEDLARILGMGYDVERCLRPMPVRAQHLPIVRRMIVYFLIKWHHTVHHRAEFEMMQAFVKSGVDEDLIDPSQVDRWNKLKVKLTGRSWLTFRIERKLDHLFA
ncbi:MAG: glycosyltransferase [Flavobacteriales bacterium]|jgi:glycosyltransferase involved in cell wall biosynthesis|nr:glycosyltransferase [Flavobacteriales bacterium]MBK6551048.1 glycosyltransferase [Flavobacteriales bacterium]MBK7111884.1 glycosyltransferase [Flavobacteriales bacterium]MBP9177750.1 glycosyltransferase [Flavobacteriales bacterium]